jgi:hypothetical protein
MAKQRVRNLPVVREARKVRRDARLAAKRAAQGAWTFPPARVLVHRRPDAPVLPGTRVMDAAERRAWRKEVRAAIEASL